jgi:hypothetical protein
MPAESWLPHLRSRNMFGLPRLLLQMAIIAQIDAARLPAALKWDFILLVCCSSEILINPLYINLILFQNAFFLQPVPAEVT